MEIKCLVKSETSVTRYQYGDYSVDVVKCFCGNGGGYFEAWLCKEGYGYCTMMFGLRATSRKDFLSIVEANIDEEIKLYEQLRVYEAEEE